MKHQSDCYRTINGVRMVNYADLCMTDERNAGMIKEAKELYRKVRKIKHPAGYYQLFVAEPKKNS
ncbi:MAG: hypothetical protein H6550_16215 [Chitinophagales bacterium]|nr:hypothetical protein [Chitinophagales bacterium]